MGLIFVAHKFPEAFLTTSAAMVRVGCGAFMRIGIAVGQMFLAHLEYVRSLSFSYTRSSVELAIVFAFSFLRLGFDVAWRAWRRRQTALDMRRKAAVLASDASVPPVPTA